MSEVFKASRWTKGNHLFRTVIEVSDQSVVRRKRSWLTVNEMSIHLSRVASVRIDTGLLFADLLIESTGGSVMLHLAAGPSVAAHLMLTADAVDAARAKELGLVHEVVDPEMLADVGKVWAQRLASSSAESMARIKASTLRNAGHTPDSLLALLKAEGEQMKAAIRSADAREGMQAFLEKRAPKFA